VHEVGHQAAALLDLVPSFRPRLHAQGLHAPDRDRLAWTLWERWISEIVADVWSVGKLGIGSTLGLIGVVSLPGWFVFRVATDDPHPVPWIRVRLSCAIGDAFYPHPQWAELSELWEALYPRDHLTSERQRVLAALEATIPRLVEVLINHRPPALRGQTLADVLPIADRRPAALP